MVIFTKLLEVSGVEASIVVFKEKSFKRREQLV